MKKNAINFELWNLIESGEMILQYQKSFFLKQYKIRANQNFKVLQSNKEKIFYVWEESMKKKCYYKNVQVFTVICDKE